eukprot:m.153955 g.153955  ORF g.153955 m.153955 type:complete len:482 (-) comp30861_c0_seq1:133-1578(-)
MASNVEKRMLLPQVDAKRLQQEPASSAVALLSFSTFGLTLFGASVQLILMIFTYVTCVRNGACEQWLPTISNTWTSHPGNFTSRIVVPFVCLLMQFAIAISYFKCVPLMEYPKANYGIGAFAFFCLSWVGAICDDTEPSCRGNNTVHTTFAITFFVLFNMYMAIVTIFVTKKSTRKNVMLTCVFLSSVCTITITRTALGYEPSNFLGGFPLVPVFEWGDVFLILAWFSIWVYYELTDYRIGFAKVPKTGVTSKHSAPEILAFLPATLLTTVASVVLAATVAATWYIAVKKEVVPGDQLPNLSDIWWDKPCNWIARWGVNLTAMLLYLHEGSCYFMNTDAKPSANKVIALALSLLGIVGAFGLAVFGTMSEKENSQLHNYFGAIFFFAYNAYMLFYVIRAASSPSQIATAMVLLCFALSSVSKLRFWDSNMLSGNGTNQTSLLAAFEWGDMLVTLLFINISVRFNPATTTQHTYGIGLFKQN